MNIQAYRDEILLKLTGYVLESEIVGTDTSGNKDYSTLDRIINSAFREMQRYYCSTRLATIPYSPCIDLSSNGVSSVSRVFRAKGYMSNDPQSTTMMADPVYMTQWQILGGNGNLDNLNSWVMNYGAWNTMLQIRNTVSTDLTFRFDKYTRKLYINVAMDKPSYITIEYVPECKSVEEVVSDYWIDILMRLSVAIAKQVVGRIRTRFTQSNALWTMDGETLLNEGNTELTELRNYLAANTQLVYPLD
ncbi:MAG: hypothetical protein ACI3T9_05000 [Romboutsia timonensis]